MSKVMARVGMDHDHALASASQSSSDKTGSCGLKKGPWTAEEDQKLVDYIKKHGRGRWRTLPKNAGLKRCGKSCRLRWTNYLRPDIKRGRFSSEEEDTIIQLHSILGNKWSAIAARLPGRTDNEIKNYWNTHIKKRLLRMGIDPVTHTPRLDLHELSSILSSSLHNYAQYPKPPNLNLLSALGWSSSLSQNKDFVDILKELVISQNIPQETQTSYPDDLFSSHQFQDQNRDTNISTSQNSYVDRYYSPYPSSPWDSNYGCLSHNIRSRLGAHDHSSYQQGNTATDEYMVPSESSINPNCGFQFDNHVEEAKNVGMGSTIASSPISNDSSFTFNVKHGAGGTCNNEEEGNPYGINSSMYDIMNHVSSYVNSIM